MPVETPRFTDELERHLRARVRRRSPSTQVGSVAAAAATVAIGAALVVVLGAEDEPAPPGRAAPSAASRPLVAAATLAPHPPARGAGPVHARAFLTTAGMTVLELRGGRGTPEGNLYAIWMTGRGGVRFLGFAPPVGERGELRGLATLPRGVTGQRLLITRERVSQPTSPGETTFAGALRASRPGERAVPLEPLERSTSGTRPVNPVPGAGAPEVLAQVNIRAGVRGSRALGVGNLVQQGGRRFLSLVAQGLEPGRRYAVWLEVRAGQPILLQPVSVAGQRGRMQATLALPDQARDGGQVLIVRDGPGRPRDPGATALRGRLPAR